jgi:penicillin V acylase-like amidase (Ntn superfamily)
MIKSAMQIRTSALVVSALLYVSTAIPCSTFFVSGSEDAVVAKNLDWNSGDGLMFVNKRNMQKRGALVGTESPAIWTSKYMSLTLTETGLEFPWEGLNETGLSAHVLELGQSVVPSPGDPRPALEMEQWIQYILDTSADLDEAMQNARAVRVGVASFVHYFVCDASAHCGVFEYVSGELIVHAGEDLPYPALANNTYDDSIAYLSQELNASSPEVILNKKSSRSLDRFSRASLLAFGYSAGGDAVSYAFSALTHLSQTTAALSTYWKMAFGLKSRTLNWTTLAAPAMKFVSLLSFNPGCKSGAQWLDVNSSKSGNVGPDFQNDSNLRNRDFIENNPRITNANKDAIADYPTTLTHCLDSTP